MSTEKLTFSYFAKLTLCAVCMLSLQCVSAADIKKVELQKSDLDSNNNMEVLMTDITFPSGTYLPLHSHHGAELVYVLEGGFIETKDGEKKEFLAGMSLLFPRGKVHGGFTISEGSTIRVISTHIVDKGKPLFIPAE